MNKVSINKQQKLSEHFTLGELTKTTYHPLDGNVPSRVAIENLTRICKEWLEDLRYTYNSLYVLQPGEDYETSRQVQGIVINSGFRSEEVNRLCGGAKGSNHLTGCAVDIRCLGPEEMMRKATILLDIADETGRDFDELILERRGTTYWIHFAVRPSKQHTAEDGTSQQHTTENSTPVPAQVNRRRIVFDIR